MQFDKLHKLINFFLNFFQYFLTKIKISYILNFENLENLENLVIIINNKFETLY